MVLGSHFGWKCMVGSTLWSFQPGNAWQSDGQRASLSYHSKHSRNKRSGYSLKGATVRQKGIILIGHFSDTCRTHPLPLQEGHQMPVHHTGPVIGMCQHDAG